MSDIEHIDSIFNEIEFLQKLETSPSPIKTFKETRQYFSSMLAERFHAGRSVTELVYLYSSFIDKLLTHAWQRFFDTQLTEDTALVAVGGYGRGELHPASDIDLLILLRKKTRHSHEPVLQFTTFLWDIGLEVGHSVRTVKECVIEAKKDITVTTNMQESRLIIGSKQLFIQQKNRCSPSCIWPSKKYFTAKLDEQIKRHERFHDTGYNLEPNIKESPGGLRDIQMIGWVAKRHYGVDTLEQLVEHGFLTANEYKTLHEGQTFLWRIRFGLHLICNRREDRLLFEHQRTLAKQFGYQDNYKHLAVEQFMKQYYRIVMELNRLNEMLLQLFQEEILLSRKNDKPVPINKRFQSRKGYLELAHKDIFKHYPFAILETFLILAQNPGLKGVRANTIRLIRNNTYLIDADFRNDLRCRSLFMALFRESHGITHELRRMNRYGILAAYLPAFGGIVGQMQHDLFHVYTVDEHTLMVVRNLRRFTVPEFKQEFPLCSHVINKIPKQELLLLAGLFHDIAKGRGGDHSTLGAIEARKFCKQHDLNDYDTNMVTWLIENHLKMSNTAQRMDISDPDVVYQFAQQMGDIVHLNYLYLLTVADIRATSDSVWNSWKDSLLKALYFATRDVLRRGLENPLIQSEYIAETKRLAQSELADSTIDADKLQLFWQNLSDEYFLRYTSEEICWHALNIVNTDANKTHVLVKNTAGDQVTAVFVYTPVFTDLFYTVTKSIEKMHLNVFDARIISTKNNFTLDTYHVLDHNNHVLTNKDCITLSEYITNSINSADTTDNNIQTFITRQARNFKFPTQIHFENNAQKQQTIMTIKAYDRPGLLSMIARALSQCKISLLTAKITTYGERAEDIFSITNTHHQPLTVEESEQLAKTIEQDLNI